MGAKKTAADAGRRQLKHWLYGLCYLPMLPSLPSHHIKLLFFSSLHSHGLAHAQLNLNLWLFAFFDVVAVWNFTILMFSRWIFVAIICLCSEPESERVIAPLHFFFERRRRRYFYGFFLIGISEAEITNRTNIKWNQRIKKNRERANKNEWRSGTEHRAQLNRSILSFRPHA